MSHIPEVAGELIRFRALPIVYLVELRQKESDLDALLRATRKEIETTIYKRVVAEERLLADQNARFRAVNQGPDGALYVLTDGAGGKILRLKK